MFEIIGALIIACNNLQAVNVVGKDASVFLAMKKAECSERVINCMYSELVIDKKLIIKCSKEVKL
jgi:hypothetical protein